MPTSTFSISGTLNNTREIEKLDLGIVVVDDSGNASESSELIGCWKGSGVCDAGEKSGLAYWREANHTDSCISEATDFKALPCFGSFGWGFKELGAVLGEFGFKLTDVILCSFVFLGPGDFLFYFFDLFCDTHGLLLLSVNIANNQLLWTYIMEHVQNLCSIS